jgi:asparagine synthase (glutamine-hydrolysing)
MSGFCGWAGWRGEADLEREVLGEMARSLAPWRREGAASVFGTGAALAAYATVADPVVAEVEGYLVAVAGQPEFRDAELTALAKEQGIGPALVAGFRKLDAGLPERMRGSFSWAVIERSGRVGLLAVDRASGRFPLSYRTFGESLVFASQATAIQAHPHAASGIDPQSLYNYLFFHMTPGPRSIRLDVRRLPPAGVAVWRDGRLDVRRYWSPTYREDDPTPLEDLAEEFRTVLREGVRRSAAGAVRLGCFLSGGTDSSTIAGLVSKGSGGPARTYSIGFAVEGYDESRYARSTVGHFGTLHREHRMEPGEVVALVGRVAAAYAEPFGNASAVAALRCADLAREDAVTRLLAGDGGDELFAGNTRYATQGLFEAYSLLPQWTRRGLIEPMLFGLPGIERVPPLRKARRYIEHCRIPLPRRLEAYNQLERTAPQEVLHPDLLSAVDPGEPLRDFDEVYRSARAMSVLNRMMALDLKFTLADNDLPKVSRMCELAGVEVAYPFLDDDVVDLSLRVPTRWKLRRGKLRWFMKHALSDFLPQDVLRKKKHGFGLPFGMWIREYRPLRDLAGDSLARLKGRAIVRSTWVDELWRRHETEHAAYYGVTIWVLMMLEQWLEAHVDRGSTVAAP